ncbi:MAG: type II toxin-antitoxin system RelE family toxin [Thiobacillus sp.]
MNTINWKPKALKQMRKISAQAGAAIRKSVNAELIDLSAARNVKALTDHAYGYRLRVGNYRVFFDFMGGDVCIVSIEEVRKRDERTY